MRAVSPNSYVMTFSTNSEINQTCITIFCYAINFIFMIIILSTDIDILKRRKMRSKFNLFRKEKKMRIKLLVKSITLRFLNLTLFPLYLNYNFQCNIPRSFTLISDNLGCDQR